MAGAVLRFLAPRGRIDLAALKRSVAELEARLHQQERVSQQRFEILESRLEQHEAVLSQVPTSSQMMAVMDALASRTVVALEHRLDAQAEALDLLTAAVSRSDRLLERLLESVDSLRRDPAPAEFAPLR